MPWALLVCPHGLKPFCHFRGVLRQFLACSHHYLICESNERNGVFLSRKKKRFMRMDLAHSFRRFVHGHGYSSSRRVGPSADSLASPARPAGQALASGQAAEPHPCGAGHSRAGHSRAGRRGSCVVPAAPPRAFLRPAPPLTFVPFPLPSWFGEWRPLPSPQGSLRVYLAKPSLISPGCLFPLLGCCLPLWTLTCTIELTVLICLYIFVFFSLMENS